MPGRYKCKGAWFDDDVGYLDRPVDGYHSVLELRLGADRRAIAQGHVEAHRRVIEICGRSLTTEGTQQKLGDSVLKVHFG